MIHFIFPPKCVCCGTILDIKAGIDLCDSCYRKIPFLKEGALKKKPGLFLSCYCDAVVCVCEYSGIIKDLLIKYKFFKKPNYYRAIAGLIAGKLKEMTNSKKFDIIISVPLFHLKEKTRGYNQSYLISKALSKKFDIPEESYLLSRIKDTGSQSLLLKKERGINIKGAFRANHPEKVNGKTILLVDDILTTGSTIDECCKVLKEAGAKEITALVVATGRKY